MYTLILVGLQALIEKDRTNLAQNTGKKQLPARDANRDNV